MAPGTTRTEPCSDNINFTSLMRQEFTCIKNFLISGFITTNEFRHNSIGCVVERQNSAVFLNMRDYGRWIVNSDKSHDAAKEFLRLYISLTHKHTDISQKRGRRNYVWQFFERSLFYFFRRDGFVYLNSFLRKLITQNYFCTCLAV